MRVTLNIETHAYAKERLRDEILDEQLPDNIESCGIVGPEVIVPLRRNRKLIMSCEYSEETTISEILSPVKAILDPTNYGVHFAFSCNKNRYWVENPQANAQDLISRYLDPSSSGIVHIAAFVSLDAGVIAREKGLKYWVNSHEAGKHHIPHVHVCDSSYTHEASLSIEDGSVLGGSLPNKKLRLAQLKIQQEKDYFYFCWNTLTDGLSVDINHHFGNIGY